MNAPWFGSILWLLSAASAINAASLEQAGADWPRYARDKALTGRSPLRGKITQPQIHWSYSTAGRELLLEILPAKGEHRQQFGPNDPVHPQRTLAIPGSPQHDLDGSGVLRPVTETYHERWAKILPQVKGWQRVAWNQTWTDQKVCRLQLFAYDQGFDLPRLVWQTDPPEDTIFQPLNIVYDIDGDGIQEICVAAHYRVMVFEGTTGRKETELRYHRSRPYGWFGLADVDGDRQMELITMGDFQSHIDVLNFDPKKPEPQRLTVRWRRDIEQNIEERTKWPQVGPQPVADVDGDGRLEIVLNLFNDQGDGQWHAMVLNGSNGEPARDFPRKYVQGTADVDHDGKAELFLIGTEGVLVPEFGSIALFSLAGGTPLEKWSQSNAAWIGADLPQMGRTWSTTASQGMRHVLLTQGTQSRAFLVAQRDSITAPPFSATLTAMRAGTQDRFEQIWRISGLPGDVQGVAYTVVGESEDLAALCRVQLPQDRELSLACQNAQARIVESRALGITVSTPIAARLSPQGPLTVVIEGAAQTIFALEPPKSGQDSPKVLWRRPGRGMGDGSRWLGPLAADLDGDHQQEVVVASKDAAGRVVLVAYRHDGSCLWQTSFPQIPGATPVWNTGALTFWWPGFFRTNGQTDLFVNTRRGLMHSDIGQLLDGRTGRGLWQQPKATVPGQFDWGYAGIPAGVADINEDGRDEILSLYPVCFWIADGQTGRLLHGIELASRKKLPAWAAYGEPMIHSFTGQHKTEVLLDSQYILALLDTNGLPMWHGVGRADYPTPANDGNVGQTTLVKHALVDFNGDGVFEIASAGYGDGVRAIDPRNGKILWSLPTPVPTCPRVATADIDGRKGDEVLYVARNKLIAITGDRSGGRILWEWPGPNRLSMPAIADLEGDGLAEIVVQDADGTVFCLK